MIEAYLHRDPSTEQGTLGVLSVPEKGFACFSIELPWRDNRVSLSCIPAGEYRCERYFSPAFKEYLYRICDVPGRSGVAIHSGNVAGNRDKGYKTHSLGCILLGKRQGQLWGQDAVLLSRLTVGAFFRLMDRKDFKLHIQEA